MKINVLLLLLYVKLLFFTMAINLIELHHEQLGIWVKNKKNHVYSKEMVC